MAINYILNVVGEHQDLQVYINSRDEIYIGETNDTDSLDHNSVVLPISDWLEIKSHIDKLIKENEKQNQ